MKLNSLERIFMNNPVRAAFQRHVEASQFERLGGKLDGKRVLEMGCGRGVGVEILLGRFKAGQVHAFDLDATMVAQTSRRLRKRAPGRSWSLMVADAISIPVPDAAYDAVVDFGAVHHIPDWRSAVAEVRRVLRPGGRFYFMEISRHLLDLSVVRALFDHPNHDRFSAAEFVAELDGRGIHVEDRLIHRLGGFFTGVGLAVEAIVPPSGTWCGDPRRSR